MVDVDSDLPPSSGKLWPFVPVPSQVVPVAYLSIQFVLTSPNCVLTLDLIRLLETGDSLAVVWEVDAYHHPRRTLPRCTEAEEVPRVSRKCSAVV